MSSPRAYAGKSLEDRVAERRARLLDAGLEGLHEDGLAQISVRTVCARAGLTARYFYESFASLDELLAALVDRVADEISAVVAETLLAADLAQDVTAKIETAGRAIFEMLIADARGASLLLASTGHAAMHARFERRALEVTDLLVAWLVPLSPAVAEPDLRLTTRFLLGGSVELASSQGSGLIDATSADLARICADQFVAGWRSVGVPIGEDD